MTFIFIDTREIHKLMEENKILSTEQKQLQKENDNLRQQVTTVNELTKTKDLLQGINIMLNLSLKNNIF